jgi:hypothetical protein
MCDQTSISTAKLKEAAHLLCKTVCHGGPHHRACLIPDLRRQEMEAEEAMPILAKDNAWQTFDKIGDSAKKAGAHLRA